jgi:hypothetical protein
MNPWRRRKVKQPSLFSSSEPERDTRVQDFLYAVSRGHSVRSASSVSGTPYSSMMKWLNPSRPQYKPDLFKLFERAKESGNHIEVVRGLGA